MFTLILGSFWDQGRRTFHHVKLNFCFPFIICTVVYRLRPGCLKTNKIIQVKDVGSTIRPKIGFIFSPRDTMLCTQTQFVMLKSIWNIFTKKLKITVSGLYQLKAEKCCIFLHEYKTALWQIANGIATFFVLLKMRKHLWIWDFLKNFSPWNNLNFYGAINLEEYYWE